MRYAIWFLWALAVVGGEANAGAWQRAEGALYASASARLSWPKDLVSHGSLDPNGQYYTLYMEYGLTDRVTLGLDMGRSVSGAGKSIGFVQLPVRNKEKGLKVSAALGLGQIEGDPVIRPGLSVGLGHKWGWINADGFAEVGINSDETDFKLDVTFGFNAPSHRFLRDGTKLIVQFQSGAPYGDAMFVRLAPSVVVPLRNNLSIEVGGSWGIFGDDNFGALLGLWSDF